MKNFFLILLVLFIASCNKSNELARVTVNYKGNTAIELRTPIDDIMLWDNKTDTLERDNNNIYSFEKEIDQPEYAIIKIGNKRKKLLLIPGDEMQISFKDTAFKVDEENKKGLALFNKLQTPILTVKEASRFRKDTTASQIRRKIDSLKKEELNDLKLLERNYQIDNILFQTLEDEINYFYALRTVQIIIGKQNQGFPVNQHMSALFDQTLRKYPLDIQYKPSSWLEYAKEVLLSKKLSDLRANGELTFDSIKELYENDKFFDYQFKIISNYKNPQIAEKVAAYNLINSSKQDNYEKGLISVFNKFKKEYPNSNYIPFLKPEIDKVVAYHEKIANKMPEDVKIMHGEEFQDFKSLAAELKGEKYYVDIWATWCGPCKIEFKHNQKLDRLLQEKGYKKLLISVDQPEMEQKWKNDIKYYDLKGLNLMASKELYSDLINNYGVGSIPRYFIIDKEGNLTNSDAPRPSNFEELHKEL